jgi:hypothetical protein
MDFQALAFISEFRYANGLCIYKWVVVKVLTFWPNTTEASLCTIAISRLVSGQQFRQQLPLGATSVELLRAHTSYSYRRLGLTILNIITADCYCYLIIIYKFFNSVPHSI